MFKDQESAEGLQEVIIVTFDKDYVREFEYPNDEVLKMTENIAKRALTEVEQFYCVSLTDPIMIHITDREHMDKVGDLKTERWTVGIRTPQGLYLLDPRLYTNTAVENGHIAETDHEFTEEGFIRLLKHELGHEAFGNLCGIPADQLDFMRWFNEGTQFYMAGQLRERLRNFNIDFISNETAKGYYNNSATVIKKIVDFFGEPRFREGLIEILSDLRDAYPDIIADKLQPINDRLNKIFESSFEKVFHFKPKKEEILLFVESGVIVDTIEN